MEAAASGLVRTWIDEVYSRQRFERIRDLAGPVLVLHDGEGTWTVSPKTYERRVRQMFHTGMLPSGKRVYALVADGDSVAALGQCPDPQLRTQIYWLQIFRVAEGKIAERWSSAFVSGVNWGELPGETVASACIENHNRSVVARWWAEMYGQQRLDELMPLLAGPIYTRHEPTGSYTSTVARHLEQVKHFYPPDLTAEVLGMNFRTLAAGDKVVGYGVLRAAPPEPAQAEQLYSFAQTFRLERGRIVESWFPGWCAGVDWLRS